MFINSIIYLGEMAYLYVYRLPCMLSFNFVGLVHIKPKVSTNIENKNSTKCAIFNGIHYFEAL